MVRLSVFMIIAGCALSPINVFGQGETVLPFLLFSPSAEQSGMGMAAVANHTGDPLAFMTNPAQLGIVGLRQGLSFGYNYVKISLPYGLPDHSFTTAGLSAGWRVWSSADGLSEAGVGVGIARTYQNLGEFIETGESGPEEIGTFTAYEWSHNLAIGAGVHSWVDLTVGITLRNVYSRLSNFNVQLQGRYGAATADIVDYGFYLDIPCLKITDRALGTPFGTGQHFSPFVDVSAGISRNNMGQESITYVAGAQADPLPRTAHAGIGIDLGTSFTEKGVAFTPIEFRWTVDVSDLLVKRYPEIMDSLGALVQGSRWDYKGTLGDMGFFDQVIGGHRNPTNTMRKGWELGVLDVFSVRGGRALGPLSDIKTSGFGFRLRGISSLLRLVDIVPKGGTVMDFIMSRCDLRYDHSEYDTGYGGSMKYDGLGVNISY